MTAPAPRRNPHVTTHTLRSHLAPDQTQLGRSSGHGHRTRPSRLRLRLGLRPPLRGAPAEPPDPGSLDAALGRGSGHAKREARHPGYSALLSQSGRARQTDRHPGSHLGRPCHTRLWCGLVRAGVHPVRSALPQARRPPGRPRRGGRDHEAHVDRGEGDLRRQPLPGSRRHVRAEARVAPSRADRGGAGNES